MTPEEQAKQLADWLEQHPGSPAPEGMAPEVVEAVYALRPDLAPAPRVSLESILEKIEEGPFAEELGSVKPAHQPRMKIWRGLGGLAAAAAVLFIALPQQEELDKIGPQLSPRTPQVEPFEDTLLSGEEAPEMGMEDAQDPDPGEPQPPAVRKEEAPPAPPSDGDLNPNSRTMAPAEAEFSEDSIAALDSIGGALAPAEGSASLSAGGLTGLGTRGSTRSGGGTAEAGGGLDVALGADNNTLSAEDEPEAAVLDPAVAEPSSASQQAAPTVEARRSFPFSSRSRGSTESAPVRSAPAPRASLDEAVEDAPDSSESAASIAPNLSSLKASAYPSDYERPGADLVPNSSPIAAQWLAADQALELLQRSSYGEARSKAEAALSLSTQNTPARSLLYWILGEAYLVDGDTDSAQKAYQQAAELNALR